jgi:pseudouridine kinase
MLTAYGDDLYGQRLQAACTAAGIDMSNALKLGDERTSTYLYITGPDGDMALAVSDMTICERIDPDYLARNRTLLENAGVVVADANIPAESLIWLAENCTAPLFIDPVSTIKAEKLRPILGRIHTLKPNRLEAELLSGVPIRDEGDVEMAADKLLAMGLRRVFISLGGDGMYAATHNDSFWGENFPCRMVNTTGCGDSSMAALVWGYLNGLSLADTVRAALAAGSITIESPETISPEMGEELLRERMAHS